MSVRRERTAPHRFGSAWRATARFEDTGSGPDAAAMSASRSPPRLVVRARAHAIDAPGLIAVKGRAAASG